MDKYLKYNKWFSNKLNREKIKDKKTNSLYLKSN